jgi:beta-lactamase regulating signal transducer with metallopeptidase domain
MNLVLATGPLAQATGWALLHLLWQGTLVAALLAVTLRLLSTRSANARYGASCLALVLVVALGIATGIRAYSSLPATAPGGGGDVAASSIGAEPVGSAATPGAVPPRAAALFASDPLRDLARNANEALPFVVSLWLFGVSLFSLRLLAEWLRAQRLVARSAAPAREPWPEVARRLGLELGVRTVVRVLESAAVAVPSVIGFVRPAILLPASALSGLTPSQLEMILAHELAHIRRHDFVVNLLQAVVETLLFYHPAVWWISAQVRQERENCCDDLAVALCGSPVQYARALTRLEELRGGAPAVAMSATGGSLVERVRRIALGPPRAGGPAARGVAALSLLVCVGVALAALALPALGQRQSKGEKPTPLSAAVHAAVTEPLQAAKKDPAAATPASVESAVRAVTTSAYGIPADEVSGDAVSAEAPPAEPGDASPADEPSGAESSSEEGVMAPEAAVEAAPSDAGDKPTIDDLIALRSQGVTVEGVRAMRAVFPQVNLQEIASLTAVGVTPNYVRAMRKAGLAVEVPEEAQGLAALGVTPAFLEDVRSAGLKVTRAEEAQGLAAVGVTSAYVRGLRSAGIPIGSVEDVQGLAAVGVTPDYVRSLRKAGVDVKKADELQSLRALGITPEFVGVLAKAGYKDLTVEQLTRLGASGLTGDFVREMSQFRSR